MPAAHPNEEPTPTAPKATAEAGADEQTRIRQPEATGRPGLTIHSAPAPASIGRYAMGEEIARGGMGAVYRATDTVLGREVAIKVLLNKFDPGSGVARRFADEARIAAQLQHPAIPPVHDFGVLPDGRPFLAMKLIKGDTLGALLAARPNPAADRGRFVAAFEQVCQALAFAHAHRVIHRDLKPANVMVGNFGEVQVMDWGLAKVLGADATATNDPDETAAGTHIQSLRESDEFTQAGSVLGTPAYMPPEQAAGAVGKINARSDVFGLGAVLAVILTGKPPFASSSAETTRVRAAQGQVEECFERLDTCGADPELVALCKRCLAPKQEDRPADAGAVASAVADIRAAADERARQAELDRVRAEGERAKAETKAAEELNTRREAEARADAERAKADAERAKSAEQRKRRLVQLALAGVVVAVLAGAGIATSLVIEQRAKDKLASELKQAGERGAAEQKRQEDLKAADELARAKQRQTRADALVQALGSADTTSVPRLIDDLKEFRDLTGTKLRELAGQPITTKPGLHTRLALLTDDPNRIIELAAYLSVCKPEELLTIRDALKPHAATVRPWLWPVLTSATTDDGKRVRVACALAGLNPDGPRWESVAESVAGAMVKANTVEFAAWSRALEPVRGVLLPKLLARYPTLRADTRGGKLDESKLAEAVGEYDRTAELLATYAKDRPAELAELAVVADPRHYKQFSAAIVANKAGVVPVLMAELAKQPQEAWPDSERENLGRRRGHAAAALIALGEGRSVWPLFAFPKDGDPTARSYLLSRLAAVGADPIALMFGFIYEEDVSAKRALVVALGEFPVELVWVREREAFAGRLLLLYREHPDPGLHGAIDWLLRQKWGKAKELATIDAELAARAREQVLARALAVAGQPFGDVVGPQLPAPRVAVGKDWFVNGEGQIFAVVRGPVEFDIGSPLSEPGRVAALEPLHRKRIARTFAIATREVTVVEFLRFRPEYDWLKQYSPGPDTPALAMTWYQAAEYCNWLSARAGIPKDQWCYEPDAKKGYGAGMTIKPGHVSLTGYRLPTEVEWEYACRSGTATARYFGRGESLLPRYGWFSKNADVRAWPVGRLRPNDRGLFDMLGNAMEWVENPALSYDTTQFDDKETGKFMSIDEGLPRLLRGASFDNQPVNLRSAYRNVTGPGNRVYYVGFRPARTLP